MIVFFQNILVVFILVGIITRISNYFFYKKIAKKEHSLYLSSIVSGILTCFLAIFLVGFDIVISEYFLSFLFWFILDLIWINRKKTKNH